MAFWTTVLVITSAFVSPILMKSGELDNDSDIVEFCVNESKSFEETEKQYPVKKLKNTEPSLPGPQFYEILLKVAEKVKRQRIFECIYNKTDEVTRSKLMKNSRYQKLVSECKSAQPNVSCSPQYPYRTIDGTCNNLKYPKWGSVLSCYNRLLPPNYKGVSGFRESECNGPLPNPRYLSLKLHHGEAESSSKYSNMLAFFGQMVAHDVGDTALYFIGKDELDCCPESGKSPHPECAPMHLQSDDPFYSKLNKTCLSFQRSAACDMCSLEKRWTINMVTSYIDCSFVYGSTNAKALELRLLDGTGKLKFQESDGGEVLLDSDKKLPPDFCGKNAKGEFCFAAGDKRGNMHTPVMSFHTVFLREHNRIAEELKVLNSHWDDETLYQETRKILSAKMQVIVFNEFLPLIVGPIFMILFRLSIQKHGYTVYDDSIDATLYTEFGAAAFRLHALPRGKVTNRGKLFLRNEFTDASPLYHDKITPLMKGLCQLPSQDYGRLLSKDLTEHLYEPKKASFGFDLPAVDIQRNRDSGMPPYVDIIRYVSKGIANVKSFLGLIPYISLDNIKRLKDVYCDVRDIDLWVGLSMERVYPTMAVGPIVAYLIALQFQKLKYGDRFYLEHEGNFTPEQLETLKKTSFSKLLCDNTKIKEIQEKAFLLPSPSNLVQDCSSFPEVDLTYWKSQQKMPKTKSN